MKSKAWRTVVCGDLDDRRSPTNTARDSGRRRVPWQVTQAIARKNDS
jgi:hypothetical protein